MFRSRTRKILRDIWSRKGRTAMVSIAVFIGVLGVVALVSTGDIMLRQLQSDLKEDELAMIRAFVSVPGGTELDNAAYLQKLRELPAVTQVQGNANYPASWRLPDDDEFSDGFIRAFSEPFGEVPMEPPRLTAGGRYPVPGKKEVAIERRMADKYGLQVGDQLILRIMGGKAEGAGAGSDIQEETWTVVGIFFHPFTYFGGAGFIPNEVSIYANYEDARYVGGFPGFSSIYARYTDYATAQRESDSFLAAIGTNSPYIVAFTFSEDPADNIFIRLTRQYTAPISMLAMLAMVVSGFLVTSVISTIVLEQNRQIGVMKSLGATRSDNFVMYAGIAFFYGLIGMVPGVLLGIPLGFAMAKALAEFASSFIEEFAISPLGVGLGVGMGLLVPVLAALLPVYNGTKVTILDAMTDLGISTTYGAGLSARLISALPLPVNIRQALSNVIRKKGRLMLTVATLTLAVGAFMGVFAVFYSLNTVFSRVFEAYGYEIQVNPTDTQNIEQAEALIEDNVESVEGIFRGVNFAIQVEGYKDQFLGTNQLQVLGIDPETKTFALDLREGTAWQDDVEREGIVLSLGVAEQLDKKAGDTLAGVIGGRAVELEIIGIDGFPFDAAFMEWRYLARLGGLTLGAPTPNQYWVAVQADGYTGVLPGGLVVAVGFDEQVGGFLTFEDGEYFSADEPGIIISAEMATKGGYQVGDSLTLGVSDNTETFPIVGIFNLPPQMTTEEMPPDLIGLHWKALALLEGRDLQGEPAPSTLFVRLDERDVTVAQVDDTIEAISDVLMDQGVTANYVNQVSVAEQNAQAVMVMGGIFSMAATVMAAVGAIGLLSSLSMSVFERQKEIGVMRAIGAGSIVVAGQFLVEGILVGVIAWLIGLPISYLLGLGLLKVLPFGFIEYEYPLFNPVAGLIGMLIIATIASLWPSIGAARKTVSEIIRYQ